MVSTAVSNPSHKLHIREDALDHLRFIEFIASFCLVGGVLAGMLLSMLIMEVAKWV